MKRPGPIVYLFGNPLSLVVLAIAAIYFIYEWWASQGSPIVAFLAFLAAGYGAGASEQLRKYHDWKREWEAMEGRRPGDSLFARVMAHPATRALVIVPIWCVFAYLVLTGGNEPTMRLAAGLFWLATLVMVVAVIVRLVRRRRPRKPTMRDVPVTVCVSVPHRSPTPSEARAALPAYCQRLLDDHARQNAPTMR
jgi:hypothetical protein